jgi:maleylacetate reductase
MNGFVYDALPARIVFEAQAARTHLARELDALNARRVMVIATEQERALAEEIIRPIRDRVAARFYGARPHVPIEVAEHAREAARREDADLLLSIGGGSTTGTAKAVALSTRLPILAIPTTYAGSEVTPVWGLTEAGRKTTGREDVVQPKVVIYDATLTLTLPPDIAVPSAMNALAHCVEAFYAPRANPITSLVAAEGIRALAEAAVGIHAAPQEREHRSLALYGAFLAGMAFATAGSGLHHKICHVLGGAYDLPHAELHTVILPQVMAFNARALSPAAGAFGVADATAAAAHVFDLAARLGAPTALSALGMREATLSEAEALVFDGLPPSNPRDIGREDVRGLLRRAFDGQRPAGGLEPPYQRRRG